MTEMGFEKAMTLFIAFLFFIGGLITGNLIAIGFGWIILIMLWVAEGKFKVNK